jgi:acetyltransferase
MLEKFFNPRGIALVGATTNQLKGGFAILFNLKQGYTGRIYPVNPRYEEVGGLRCYPSVEAVPDPVDMAIIFIPAARVLDAVSACARRGIRAIMIQSAGFAESGKSGRDLQDKLLDVSRASGARIWGPNCMGILDAHRKFVFSFASSAIWEEGLAAGPVSLVVQSGLLAAGFLIDHMTHGTMGIAKACSIGNKSDVDECDILEHLLADPDTGAVAMYLESIQDGRRFIDICRQAAKPIVVLKGGLSQGGAAAALSHTASLAGDGAVVSGVLAHAGVTQASDFGQLMDLAKTLAVYPQVRFERPPRVAVMTYSGAAGIVSADFVERKGLALATLSSGTVANLKLLFPDWMPVGNPVDLWPAIESHGPEKVFREALQALCDDPGVDLVVLHVFAGGRFAESDMAPLVEIARQADKPLLCWVLGTRAALRPFTIRTHTLGVPVFREVGRSIECAAALCRPPVVAAAPSTRKHEIGARCRQMLAAADGVLDENESKNILLAAGIETVEEVIVTGLSEALTAADRIGYPVVLKGLLEGVVHKTERGLIELDIHTDDQLGRAFEKLSSTLPSQGSFLIQRHVEGALEFMAGMVRDRQFGPCVMCGLGGIFAEALADRSFAPAPLNREEALAMVDRLKSSHLLDGWRGQPPADRTALADILVALAALGLADDRIQEIDLNPLVISGGRPIAVDATIILE